MSRLRIFNATIGQTVLWGAASWNLTRRRLQKIRGFHLRCLRHIFQQPRICEDPEAPHPRIQFDRHILREMERLKSPMLDVQLVEKYVRWAGHAARLPADRPLATVLRWRDLAWFRAQKKQSAQPHGTH